MRAVLENHTLPFYYRSQAIAFLDDEASYLDVMSSLIAPNQELKLFHSPVRCLQYLELEPLLWEQDALFHDQMIENWRDGQSLIAQALNYWGTQPQRFGLMKACFVDYAMPSMTGIDFLTKLWGWNGSRILLTGQADALIAVEAFNKGLIDQYLPKQTPDIGEKILDLIEKVLRIPDPRYSQIWHATLNLAQTKALQSPTVISGLQNRINSLNWSEYIIMGHPFGILGLQADGKAQWLQLSSTLDLDKAKPLSSKPGRSLDYQIAARYATATEDVHAITNAGDKTVLFGQLHDITPEHQPSALASYSRYLEGLGERKIST